MLHRDIPSGTTTFIDTNRRSVLPPRIEYSALRDDAILVITEENIVGGVPAPAAAFNAPTNHIYFVNTGHGTVTDVTPTSFNGQDFQASQFSGAFDFDCRPPTTVFGFTRERCVLIAPDRDPATSSNSFDSWALSSVSFDLQPVLGGASIASMGAWSRGRNQNLLSSEGVALTSNRLIFTGSRGGNFQSNSRIISKTSTIIDVSSSANRTYRSDATSTCTTQNFDGHTFDAASLFGGNSIAHCVDCNRVVGAAMAQDTGGSNLCY